jgi:hypothetical protein
MYAIAALLRESANIRDVLIVDKRCSRERARNIAIRLAIRLALVSRKLASLNPRLIEILLRRLQTCIAQICVELRRWL